MAMWPFRRRSSRKRSRSGAALSDVEGPPARSQTESAPGANTAGATAAAKKKKKQRTEPAKLQRRRYSFSPGRQDNLGLENGRRRRPSPERHGQNPERSREGAWDRTPTLHHNQARKQSSRPKGSSKRIKKETRARAAEIKAMGQFDPVRPAAEDWTSGRPMKKESKRAKSNPNFGGRPASDVSLPLPGSIHSSLSSESEFQTFRVSALASLAPRPTLRYTPSVRHNQHPNKGKALAEREPIAEEAPQHKRVDDLADDLTARDLRELMEREDRRREKKRQRDRERAERRLARQAEQQIADREEARKSGTPPPENLERGIAGRDLVGLGIDPASTRITTSEKSDEKRYSGASEQMPDADDAHDADNEQQTTEAPRTPEPVSARQDPDVTEAGEAGDTIASPKPQDSATSLAPSSRLAGILRSKKSKSRSTLASERDKTISPPPDVIDEESAPRHSSWSSDKRGRFSLTSFIRWGGKSRRSSGGPSFSNTSREEMQASSAAAQAQTPAQALARLQSDDLKKVQQEPQPAQAPGGSAFLSRGPSNGGSKLRTKSRFREDLPDFPISPPDSRVQSPEAEAMPSAADEGRTQPIPIPSRQQQISPEPPQSLSISLASIDSEGSWLSGRVGTNRRSALRDSLARANRVETETQEEEDLDITDDDYMARLAPHHQGHASVFSGKRDSSTEPETEQADSQRGRFADDLANDPNAKLGAVGGSRPYYVHDRSTIQSYQGLMNIDSGDDYEDAEEGDDDRATNDSPVTPTAPTADLERATSVNLGKGHVRNFSAGSAKLLDVTQSNSVDRS